MGDDIPRALSAHHLDVNWIELKQ